ncbi:MAG: outer membrane beta-barrel protein [bacterium]
MTKIRTEKAGHSFLKSKHLFLLPALCVLFSIAEINAQECGSNYSIDLKLSFFGNSNSTSNAEVNAGSVKTESGSLAGKIVFNYAFDKNWAITSSVGMLSANNTTLVSFSKVYTESASVLPVLIGVKYFPLEYSSTAKFSPYLLLTPGIYLGASTRTEIIEVENKTQSAVGFLAGAGIDLKISSLVKLNLEGGYNLVTDFDTEIAGEYNYSGGEFSLGIGFMF